IKKRLTFWVGGNTSFKLRVYSHNDRTSYLQNIYNQITRDKLPGTSRCILKPFLKSSAPVLPRVQIRLPPSTPYPLQSYLEFRSNSPDRR
uniref:Uncharacterized protein n=1 Tax=Triticum urartu TaxID=4572 RepID=A0A8R7UFQ6_TRIUA